VQKYNRDIFYLDVTKLSESTDRGWDHIIQDPQSTPGHQDFLYVAVLWYHDELPDGDLEESGSVLIDENTELQVEDYKFAVDASIARPVHLEYVPFKLAYDPEVTNEVVIKQWEEAFKGKEGVFMSEYTPEMKAASDAMNAEHTRMELEEEAKIEAKATFILNAKYRCWDDDAFGFVIGTGI